MLASVAILAAVCALPACSKPAPTAHVRPPPQVIVARPEVRDVPVEVHAPVDLRPIEQVDVGSKVLGYVDAVFVDRGDPVKKGQLIALVRPSDLPDQLAAARGTLAQTESSLALARSNYDRAEKLGPTGVVSQQELQQSAAQLASAEAAEAAAKAQIGALAVRIGETRIESPLDGVVSVRRLDPGALVGPPGGGAIVTIVKLDKLRVLITVGERDAAGVTVGKRAHVELDALPNKTFSGQVTRMAPSFDPITRTLVAQVLLTNESGELRPGMYGRGSIVLDTHPHAITVPAAALQISDGKSYVYVLTGTKVVRRPVEVGVDEGTWIEITTGLAPTDEIVIAGADGISDGSTVRPVRDVDPFRGPESSSSAPAAPSGTSARPD